jgi:hypothetical protein
MKQEPNEIQSGQIRCNHKSKKKSQSTQYRYCDNHHIKKAFFTNSCEERVECIL